MRDGQARDVRGRAGDAARHRSRHLSVRDLVECVDRRRLHRASACRRARSAACSASPRRTRRASVKGRCRPNCPARSPIGCAKAARSTARQPAGRGAAAGTTPSSSAIRRASTASTRIALTKLDVLDGLPEVLICTGYKTRRQGRSPSFPPTCARSIGAEPVYETMPGWTTPTKGVHRVRRSCRPKRSATSRASKR